MRLSPINRLNIVAILILLLYVVGAIFPDLFWSTHALAFFPITVRLIVILFSFLILFGLHKNPMKIDLSSNITIGFISLATGIILYHFPILHDNYGDSYKFTKFLGKTANVIPTSARESLYRFGIGTSDGEASVLAVITYLSHYLDITYGRAFLWTGVFCGSLFVLAWQLFIRYMLKDQHAQFIALMSGCTAPFLLIFFGHIEIYAPIFLLHTIWMMLLVKFYQSRQIRLLWVLIPLWLICLKLHAIAVLYFPALVLTLVSASTKSKVITQKVFSPKGLFYAVILPFTLVGTCVYFFVLEDYKDPRTLKETVEGIDRLFLPIVSPEPPLDKYNLFSPNHIFDLLVLPFLWSPICIYLLTFFLGTNRKSIEWNNPSLLLIGLILALNCLLFFAINPLLSMPIDWDLFCLPAIPFLIFTALIMQQYDNHKFSFAKLTPGVFSITLISIPFFILHSFTPMLSQRYEALGMRIYHSYYEWTNTNIEYAVAIGTTDLQEKLKRSEIIINKMSSNARLGIDTEFARVLTNHGKSLSRDLNQFEQALLFFTKSELYDPNYVNTQLLHMEALFELKRYDKALEKAEKLIIHEYPSAQKSIAMAIHCALKAKNYSKAKKYSSQYINQWENEIIDQIHDKLQNNQEVEKLHLLLNE